MCFSRHMNNIINFEIRHRFACRIAESTCDHQKSKSWTTDCQAHRSIPDFRQTNLSGSHNTPRRMDHSGWWCLEHPVWQGGPWLVCRRCGQHIPDLLQRRIDVDVLASEQDVQCWFGCLFVRNELQVVHDTKWNRIQFKQDWRIAWNLFT